MIRLSLTVGAALLLAATLGAQYAPGDAVVTDQRNVGSHWPLWGVTPQGAVYTVTTALPFYAWSIAPAPDNRSLWASGKGNAGYTTATIAPDGSITTINVDLKLLFGCIDVDGGGNVILGNLVGGEILRYAQSAFTTLHAGPPTSSILGGGIDLGSGDLVVVERGALYRASLYPRTTVSTVLAGIPAATNSAGLHADAETGTMVGSWGTSLYRVALGSPGQLTTLASPPGTLGALDRDPRDGQFVVPSATNSPAAPSALYRFDARTGTVTTLARLPGVTPLAATVAGSRHLAAGNEARPGQSFSLLVSSPAEPGAFYVVGASLSYGPGIPVGGGRKIYLGLDDLLLLSLTSSGIFSGFQGTLNANGEALATLAVPALAALSGLRFFVAAVTLVNGQVSVISDTLGVTIR